jgi:acetyl-CoA C-acetyltransferase
MASSIDPRTPVIVGAGQIVQRPGEGDLDPIALAVAALRRAGEDSATADKLLRRADSVRHVATTCWPYGDAAALIAQALGARPRETLRTSIFGGDEPQRLVGDTAQTIAAGELDIALVSGSEAVASLLALQRAGERPAWSDQGADIQPTRVLGTDRMPSNEAELAVGLLAPIFNYALLESAVRARAGTEPASHLRRVGELWSRFSEVAAGNPYAWLPSARTAQELIEPTPANRPVSAPYLKLLTANIQVDQASGLIMCSAAAAEAAGVPRERWVFVYASAHAYDEWFMSERTELAASPAIRAVGAAALEHAGLSIDDIAYVDLYSCFPSAVQIAAGELGLALDDPSRPLTVTGGLTFAGGPGNNYGGHAIATLVERLRSDAEGFGLASAMGWYVTKHAIGVYSARPPTRLFAHIDAGEEVERSRRRRVSSEYRGVATVEAYTVPFGRDGAPETAIISAIAPDGMRVLARSDDDDVIGAVLQTDPLGRRVTVGDPGRLVLEDAEPVEARDDR